MAAVMTEHDDGPMCPQDDQMPQAWCAHCRGHERLDQRRIPRPPDGFVRHRFYAASGGWCSECGQLYRNGGLIGVTFNDEYVCTACAWPAEWTRGT